MRRPKLRMPSTALLQTRISVRSSSSKLPPTQSVVSASLAQIHFGVETHPTPPRLHGCPASHIEASVTALLALPVPPILRMAWNDSCPRRRVRPDLPFIRRRN
jgi:hypothetical protein